MLAVGISADMRATSRIIFRHVGSDPLRSAARTCLSFQGRLVEAPVRYPHLAKQSRNICSTTKTLRISFNRGDMVWNAWLADDLASPKTTIDEDTGAS